MASAASATDPDDRRPYQQVPTTNGALGVLPGDTVARPPDEIVPETQPEEEDDLPAEKHKLSKLTTDDKTGQHEGLVQALDEGRASEGGSDEPRPLRTEEAPPVTTETHGRRQQVPEMSSNQQAGTTEKSEVEEECKLTATAEQLAAALQHSLQTATYRKPRPQAWLDLVQQLFETVFPKSPSKKKNMSAAAQRLPRLNKSEMERLVDAFEDIVVNQHQDWTSWSRLVVVSCHTVYNSRQSLEYVLSKELGKVSVQTAELHAPVLTQWAQKVVGQQEEGGGVGVTPKEFLFNQSVYSTEETTHLRRVCEKTYGKHSKGAFREGTEDEWRVVQGIVEGTIICRRLPQFFNRIMRTEDKLRIIGTVRAQVEGLLIMDLDNELPVKEAFQSTKSLQESISIAAMNRSTDNHQLWGLLAAVKTISYNAAKHEIHFYFFTREAANRFDGLAVPFHRATHTLVNAHPAGRRAHGANVWDLQYEEDGALISTASEYVVILRNVTRNMDLSRLHAFLKYVLRVPFTFEDLDQSGPHSSTSTAWELSFDMDGCPRALEGITRILWFTSVIVVQHPSMRGRQQCLRCGRLGHPMRACHMSVEELRGPGCLVATEGTLASLRVQPPTFTSLEELRAAVTASSQAGESRPSDKNRSNGADSPPERAAMTDPEPKSQGGVREVTAAEPKEAWFDGKSTKKPNSGAAKNRPQVNIPIPQGHVPAKRSATTPNSEKKNGRVAGAHPNAKAGSRYNPLTVESADEKSSQEDEQQPEQPNKPKLTAAAIRKAHAELLVAEDAALAELAAALAPVPTTQARDPAPPATSATTHGEVALEQSLPRALAAMGLRQVSTPSSGNCQVYSVAQALANGSFSDTPDRLAQAATALKKGCAARAFIDFPLKYPHAQRKQTLLQLGRGYEKITPPVSEEEFRRYLTEYGSSSSDPAVFLPGKLWGSNDTLAAYGTMLQRDIFVISFVPGKTIWSALHYEPETRHANKKDYSTCGEFPLSADGCVRKVIELKRKAGSNDDKMPLVLHYQDKHYSAYVHSNRVPDIAADEEAREEDVEMTGSDDGDMDTSRPSASETTDPVTAAQATKTGELSQETDAARGWNEEMKVEEDAEPSFASQYGSQSPWDPEAWGGNIAEIEERMNGPTIHHALKQEIDQILRVGGKRTQELLHFLVATVSQLSLHQQQRLLAADLSDPEQCKEYMVEFQIPEPVVQQWRQRLEEENSGETLPVTELESSSQDQADPDYYPSSTQSSDDLSTFRVTTPRRILRRNSSPAVPGKRAHTTTPVERRVEDGLVVNVNNRAVPLKKRNSDDPTKNLLTMFEEADSPSRLPQPSPPEGMPSWPKCWSAYAGEWAQRSAVPFPVVDASVETWLAAVQQDRDYILHLLRTFSHSHEIVQLLAPQVLDELTSPWRDECWQHAIEAGQQDEKTDPSRVRRLAQWGLRAERAVDNKRRKAIMTSSDEWDAEKAENYGRDVVMWLCAPSRTARFSHYLLFAHIYAEKVAAMIGEDCHPDDSARTKLQRHLTALRKLPTFKAAFLTNDKAMTVKWGAIGRYMAQVVDDGDGAHQNQLTTMTTQIQY